jgi:hypothetical protein
MWAYKHWFRAISRCLGYGRVDDRPSTSRSWKPGFGSSSISRRLSIGQNGQTNAVYSVTLTGAGLAIVTARPNILISKGIWSVPGVEVGERRFVGHATSEQLAQRLGATISPH